MTRVEEKDISSETTNEPTVERKEKRRLTKFAQQDVMSQSVLDVDSPRINRRIPRQTIEVKYVAKQAGFSNQEILDDKQKVREAVTLAISGLKSLPSKGNVIST